MRWLTLALCVTGCATATELDVLATKKDSGVDTTPADTGPVEDTAKPSCEGKPGATCKPGATRSTPCGNCGTVTDTCDTDTCTWAPGKCSGEGPCEPGFKEPAACTTAGETKERTCSPTCTWGEYGACGVLNPWSPTATPPVGFEGRYHHTAVWTGTEMIVFGGIGASGAKKDGAAYDPEKNVWRPIAAPPAHFSKGRKLHSAVWTGSKMIIWGGIDGDNFYAATNAAYDPKTDTWSDVKSVAIAGRGAAFGAWTGTEMLIFGGGDSSDGALYNPTADSWTVIPAPTAPIRAGTNNVLVGDKLVTWGACFGVSCTPEGATFDLKTKTWTKLADAPASMDGRFSAVATTDGTAAIFWSGYGGTDVSNLIKKTGARWDPTAGWKSMATADSVMTPVAGRESALGWVASGKLFVFGGKDGGGPSATSGGAIYDIASDKWSVMPAMDAPSARIYASLVWTGKDAVIWGGTQTPGVPAAVLRDGARYRP